MFGFDRSLDQASQLIHSSSVEELMQDFADADLRHVLEETDASPINLFDWRSDAIVSRLVDEN